LVVLDEVDAPLDGRNVERYVDILRSFKGTTQFLVITHNPVTIEAAPIWFGVTMRDPGITTVLQCKAPDQESVLMAVVPEAQYLPETNDLVTP
jgi:chromosome segregation protein